MKPLISTLFISLVSLLVFSCTTGKVPSKDPNRLTDRRDGGNSDFSTVKNDDTNQTLDNYLKRIAGVSVNGTGASATVTIRGMNSINLSNEPLFILDGVQIASYSSVYSAVNPMEIGSVQVLKNPADTGIYGVRGANGVIIITRKNTN